MQCSASVKILTLLALLPLVSCVAGSPVPPDPATEASPYRAANVTPAWATMPLSWEKLDAIESWLGTHRFAARKSLVARAELEMAEGRLSFAKRETGTPAQTLSRRVAIAEEGFRSVLGNPGADASMLRRAHQGLREAKNFHATTPAASKADSSVALRSSWRARAADHRRMTRHTGRWNSLTVHHSARTTREQLGGGSLAEVSDALRRVQKVHMSERGWGDIGYHFLIDPRGRVFEGRSMSWQGAHANGANNVGNIGVCLLGHFDQEAPREAALEALERLVGDLTRRHGIPRNRIYAHKDLRPTECPGQHLLSWVRKYRGTRTAAAHHGRARNASAPTIR